MLADGERLAVMLDMFFQESNATIDPTKAIFQRPSAFLIILAHLHYLPLQCMAVNLASTRSTTGDLVKLGQIG